MKHLLCLAALLCILPCGLNAQEIKTIAASADDYIEILQDAGYRVFTFDVSEFKDNGYTIDFSIREYSKGVLLDEMPKGRKMRLSNRTMVSEFPEESQREVLQEGRGYDLEKGIYTLAEKISISIRPTKVDSVSRLRLSVENQGSFRMNLDLRPAPDPDLEEPIYMYETRPFKLQEFKENEFTPLVLYGSFWYDERFKLIRFCGETEMDPDMSNDMFKDMPHYYVIGITLQQKGND